MPRRRKQRDVPLACHICDVVTDDYMVSTVKLQIKGELCITMLFVCQACLESMWVDKTPLTVEMEKLWPGYNDEVLVDGQP